MERWRERQGRGCSADKAVENQKSGSWGAWPLMCWKEEIHLYLITKGLYCHWKWHKHLWRLVGILCFYKHTLS